MTEVDNLIEEQKIAKAEAAAEKAKQYKENDGLDKKAVEEEKVAQGEMIRKAAMEGLKSEKAGEYMLLKHYSGETLHRNPNNEENSLFIPLVIHLWWLPKVDLNV